MYQYKASFCICTYNRNDYLKKLLDSISEIVLPNGFNNEDIKIVIVDNFDGRSKSLVISNNSFPFKLLWFHEKNKGLSYARNRTVNESLDAEFCFFIDDDEILDKYCLAKLLETQVEYDADLVYGSNPPIFEKQEISDSIKYFFRAPGESVVQPITYAPTNCTLVRTMALESINGPFDMRFNLNGGEDSFLTRQLYYRGDKLFQNTAAKAYEYIPASRCTLSWIVKRSFRVSTSLTYQDKLLHLGLVFYFKRIIKAIVKILLGLVYTVLLSLFPIRVRYWGVIQIFEGFGHIAGYFGIHPEEYK